MEFRAKDTLAYLVRIEVGIEDDHRVRCPEINPDTSSTRRQNVHEYIGVWLVELIHVFLTIRLLGVAILKEIVSAAMVCNSHATY